MTKSTFSAEQLSKTPPKQQRGQKTIEKLLMCAQDILVDSGFEALNSNAVVSRAGMTPPAFYRYFKDKHDLLRVLCERLMLLQNEVLIDEENWKLLRDGDFAGSSFRSLKRTYEITRDFKGGDVLLQLLRALPELKPIRLESHNYVAEFMADNLYAGGSKALRNEFIIRSRVSVEIGYSIIEMLFETDSHDHDLVLKKAAVASSALFDDLREHFKSE